MSVRCIAKWVTAIFIVFLLGSYLQYQRLGWLGTTIDFPFRLKHDPAKKSITFRHSTQETNQPEQVTPRIEAFLNVRFANCSGTGPDYWRSEPDSDQLYLDTFGGNVELTRDGNKLLVDGQELPEGHTYEHETLLNWRPWLMGRVEFKNLGLVTIAHRASSKPRLAVYGSHETLYCPLKGGVLSAIVGLAALLIWRPWTYRFNKAPRQTL